MTEKNNQAAEKDLVAAASDTESVNDVETAEGRGLITEQKGEKGVSAPASTTAADRDEKTPIIFLDDVHVVFKTRTGSILHPNKVHAVNGLTLKLMPGETIGLRQIDHGKRHVRPASAHVGACLLQGNRCHEAYRSATSHHRPRDLSRVPGSGDGAERPYERARPVDRPDDRA